MARAPDKSDTWRSRSPYAERGDVKIGPMDFVLTRTFGGIASRFENYAGKLAARVKLADDCAALFTGLSDAELAEAARQLRGPLLRHGFRADLVARSFALVREATFRVLRIRHHAVQLMGAWAMIDGRFAEMQTGEGKTLTALPTAITAALSGRPVHVITVNDYLAARDAEELEPIYRALGLTVGVIQHDDEAEQRRAAYACDVTYGVNKEIAFDYLRDGLKLGDRRSHASRMAGKLSGANMPPLLLHGLYFAIVDEADSILIDEARTPLIIAGAEANPLPNEVFAQALGFANQLKPHADFVLYGNAQNVELTPAGTETLKKLSHGLNGIWEARKGREELVNYALAALHHYKIDQHYVVVDGKVEIIDEFTGRIAEGRSWQHGLHQLIETKENCEITARHATQTSITYQRFFRRYLHLCGMSGTISEVAGELRAVYDVPVVRIPTHRPTRRTSRGTRMFATSEQKWSAVVDTVLEHRREGRPTLIGTRAIETSELLSKLLNTAGIDHVVLNAHHDRQEADIVAEAGRAGRVTVATNMAGRGTDIKLGDGVEAKGGLHVVLTEFHESARIDRQLIGRGGRQGQPGTYEIIAALDDELPLVFASGLARLFERILAGKPGPLPATLARILQLYAQDRAQRLQYRIRQQTLRLQDQRDNMLAFARPD
ncbi:helicase-related protein [Frankia sp. RB7]|nr:helicase-related protein [Frankia sp. RB7]